MGGAVERDPRDDEARPPRVRVLRSARRAPHGAPPRLHTESSHRFERGVDPGDAARVLEHAARLTCRLGRGVRGEGSARRRARSRSRPCRSRSARRAWTRSSASTCPSPRPIAILERLGFALQSKTATARWRRHRPDAPPRRRRARSISSTRSCACAAWTRCPRQLPAIRARARRRRSRGARPPACDAPRARSASPRRSPSASRRKSALEALGAPAPVMLENPLGEERDVMRTTLLPGLLDARPPRAPPRRARRAPVHDRRGLPAARRTSSPKQRASFAAVLAGDRPAWLESPKPFDVWDAKGFATAFIAQPRPRRRDDRRRCAARRAQASPPARRRGDSRAQDTHRDARPAPPRRRRRARPRRPRSHVARRSDLELDLDALGAQPSPRRTRRSRVSPRATRDIALVVKDGIPAGDVDASVREAAGPLAEDVQLFDRFSGGPTSPRGLRQPRLPRRLPRRGPHAHRRRGRRRARERRRRDVTGASARRYARSFCYSSRV